MNGSRKENGRRPGHPHKKRRSGALAVAGKVVGTLCLIGMLTCAMLACFAAVYIKTIIVPKADLKLTDYSTDLTSYMYYFDPDTGERKELQTLHGEENRVWVSYDEIPEDLINAAVAIEDKTFWTHHGVNWKRTIGAVGNMFLQMKDTYGGSTITQQLIKNVTGNNEGTVKRKITEIFRALEFEKNYSKETIMEWYLNYIYLGEKCNGVYTASYAYFGKHVSELSLAECASLIGITNNPSKYNPYLSLVTVDAETGEEITNVMRNKQRQETILYEMLSQGMISRAEYDEAVAEELVFVRGSDGLSSSKVFSWYEDQVINDVVADLQEKYDYLGYEAAIQMVYSGGLQIETCLDSKVQAWVDAVYEDRDNLPYVSSTGQQLESAITIIDNETGDIVAMAGGMGEKTGSRLNNRATSAVRQPGSSIKPLAVYAPAIELGLIDPATVIDDAPIALNDSAWPKNSYNYYKGRMTVFEAVEVSSNPVAVRVMRDYITPQVSYDFMTGKLNFTTLVAARERKNGQIDSDIDLAPLSLGGLTDGVTTLEMAAAYAAFPRMGIYTTPRTYTRVYDANGELILENESRSSVAMEENTAYYINYMLQNVVRAGTGTEAAFSGMSIAGKTGTTTNNYDRWFVGYTPYYTAAVWTGYDQNERLKVSGNPAAQLWRKVMSGVHSGLSDKGFQEPADGVVTQEYCLDSGLLPNEYCPNDARGSRVTTGTFVKGDTPTEYCTLHAPVTLCKDDPILDANGEATGMYHLAGEYCPEESRISVAVLDYERPDEGVEYTARDGLYLKNELEALGTCHTHTQPIAQDPFDWPWSGGEEEPEEPDDGSDDSWHWPWENLPTDSDE